MNLAKTIICIFSLSPPQVKIPLQTKLKRSMGNDLQVTPTRLIRKWFLHCQGEFFLFQLPFPPPFIPILVATSFLIENFRFLVRPAVFLVTHGPLNFR